MPTRTANAQWDGTLTEGSGKMAFGSGAFEGQYSFKSRFEEGTGTNPEELIAAAHAGCFSMAFSLFLEQAGHKAESIATEARVRLDPQEGGGFAITGSHLVTRGRVAGIDEDTFQKVAADAKAGCPVSQALAGVNITIDATLEQ